MWCRMRKVPVILSKCGIDSGTCDKDCATLEVEEHQECSCSCSLLQEHCRPDQLLRPDLCSCQCRDILGKQSCLDAGRIWDDSLCSCGCSQQQDCSTGLSFDSRTCSCVMLDTKLVVDENRAPRSHDEPFPSFMMIIIVALLSVILVLLLTVFALIMKIQRMKRNYRTERMKQNLPKDGNGDYSPVKPDEGGFTDVNRSGEGGFTEVNCSTPSSGFYSEVGTERPEFDHLYQSADQVRRQKQNKVIHFSRI